MRRICAPVLAGIALIAIVVPAGVFAQQHSEAETVSRSATQFALDLYRLFSASPERQTENLFFSPYSIYTVLALMYGGAAGETAEQMAAALHVQPDAESFQAGLADIQSILNQIGERGAVQLDIANSLWPQSGAALKPEFLQLAERYLAEVNPLDYRGNPVEAQKRINAWGQEKTNRLVKEVLRKAPHRETHLLLANAIYFKGDWAWKFDEAETQSMPFQRLEGGAVEVPMMFQLGRFPFAWIDSVQIVQLPYQGGDLSMTVILPENPRELPTIEKQLTPARIASWQQELFEQDLYVYLPRFEITSAFDLIGDGSLRALGMTRALDQFRAEFPGIAEPANWFSIQIFVQGAVVKVNEQGTEAAAVTVGGCFPAGTPVPTPNGIVPIEQIESGTAVYAFDLVEGRWVITQVAHRRPYPFSGQMFTIRTGGETIETTWNHPFLVVRGEDLESRPVPMDLPAGEAVSTDHGRWVQAREIRTGDVLLSRRGGTVTVTGTSAGKMKGEVYYLEIQGFHNHAVGGQGILVHNGDGEGVKCSAGPMEFRADHPFLFFIQDQPTGSILFMGRVMDPASAE
jgi:serpin B